MRKEKVITIEEGRDKGKKFKVIEMSAYSADCWATRALMVILSSGAELPDGVDRDNLQGIQGLSMVLKYGLKGLTSSSYDTVKPLLDELLGCCYFLPDGASTTVQLTPSSVDGIIEDMSTLFKLKMEAFTIHFDFLAGGESKI